MERRFVPPAHACDSHAHIYGPKARFPYPAELAGREPADAVFEDYAHMHAELGFERGVISQSQQYRGDHSALLDALERGAPHLRGIGEVELSALTDRTIADWDRRGIRGLRLHREAYGDLEEFGRRIAGVGWRIEIVPASIEEVVALRSAIERTRCAVGLDQFGLPDVGKGLEDATFQALVTMVREGIIWMKFTHPHAASKVGPPYADVLPFAEAFVAANPARCLWGSNWPWGTRWNNAWPKPRAVDFLNFFADCVPDEATRHRILVDNPATLNRFPDA